VRRTAGTGAPGGLGARRRRAIGSRRGLIVVLAAAAFGIAACGGSDEPETAQPTSAAGGEQAASGGKLEDAKKAAEEKMAPVTAWPGPTDSPPAAEDKFIVLIPCALAAEGCARQITGAKAAAKVLGWRTLTIDGQGSPDVYTQAIQQAINQKADGIFLVGIADNLVAPAIKEAREKGLAVVSIATENKPSDEGVSEELVVHFDEAGYALGAWACVKSEGKGKFAVVNGPEFPSVTLYLDNAKRALQEFCPEAEIVAEMDVAVADLGTQHGPRLVAMLQANPQIEYVFAPYDPSLNAMAAAVREAGLAEQIKGFMSVNGDPQNLQMIKDGDTQIADIASPLVWGGWAGMDTFNRIFNEEEPVGDQLPVRVFTSDNADDIPEKGFWEGDFDYESEYKKLWGK
jgi:ribose transport system substrate-binding protein